MGKIGSSASAPMSKLVDSGNLPSRISGGAVDLYNSGSANVKITFGTPLSEPLHFLGANEKFQKTNINLISAQAKAFGIGGAINLTKIRDNGIEINFDGSIIAGGEITFRFEDWSIPEIVPNGYVGFESGIGVGALGVGIGTGLGVNYDDGAFNLSGFWDGLGIIGFSGQYVVCTRTVFT